MDEILDPRFVSLLRQHLRALPESQVLSRDTDMKVFGLDSYASVALIVDIEESYGVTFPSDALVPEIFATPGALWKALSAVLKGSSPEAPGSG
jgi:acyl carrier protein